MARASLRPTSGMSSKKVVKYNHLVANMLILHNVEALSRVLRDMAAEGIAITEDVLKALSPSRTRHINRFGDYTLDFRRPVGQQLFDLKLAELTPQGTPGDQVNPKYEPK